MGLGRPLVGTLSMRAGTARAERRAMIALFTAFALLVQAWIPSLAMAAPASAAGMTICTPQGEQTAPSGSGSDQGPSSHACQHSVCPALVSSPPPMAATQRVAYAVAEAPVTATPRGVRPLPRAPPRPPGQGPPLSDA